MIHLKLPLPPSINSAYAGKEIRYKSDKYKKWEASADKELMKQDNFSITGDEWLKTVYVLHIDLHFKNWNKRIIDVANYEKALSDFLGGSVDKITRKTYGIRHRHLWIQRIPWFHDHKIIENTQKKVQKEEWEEDWIEVFISEIVE